MKVRCIPVLKVVSVVGIHRMIWNRLTLLTHHTKMQPMVSSGIATCGTNISLGRTRSILMYSEKKSMCV